jgi:hypothetical protein
LGALPSVFEGGAFDFSLIILRRFHLIRLKTGGPGLNPKTTLGAGCPALGFGGRGF